MYKINFSGAKHAGQPSEQNSKGQQGLRGGTEQINCLPVWQSLGEKISTRQASNKKSVENNFFF